MLKFCPNLEQMTVSKETVTLNFLCGKQSQDSKRDKFNVNEKFRKFIFTIYFVSINVHILQNFTE